MLFSSPGLEQAETSDRTQAAWKLHRNNEPTQVNRKVLIRNNTIKSIKQRHKITHHSRGTRLSRSCGAAARHQGDTDSALSVSRPQTSRPSRQDSQDIGDFSVAPDPDPGLLDGDHPDGHDAVREAVLALDGEDLQARLGNDAPHDVEVAADAAVQGVQLAALPRHIVLDDHHAVWTQTPLAANQEVQQVFIRQVT